MKITGKMSSKRYKCQECEHESMHSTNHYGEFYDRCPKCSWKSPMSPIKVHECLEPLPERWEKPTPWKMVKLEDVCEVKMQVIRDIDGNPIRVSRNLRGIRRYAGKHACKSIDASPIGQEGEGLLSMIFENGCTFQTRFASFAVLMYTLNNWRNLYGTPIRIRGDYWGILGKDNPPESVRSKQ